MHKLDIKLGGDPLLADDILFLQQILSDAIKGIVEMTGQGFIIISGVDITLPGGNIAWTDGWIYMNGEFCKVDAGSLAYPANNTFQIVQSFDANGNEVYEDLNIEDTYVLRKATILGNAGGTYLYSNVKRLKDYLVNDSIAYVSIMTIAAGNWSIPGSGIIPTYRKDKAFTVELNGSISVASYAAPGDLTVMTLPAGFRPAAGGYHRFVCSAIVNGTRTALHVEVIDTGAVKVYGLVATNACELFLDAIRFPADWDGGIL